MDAYPKLVERFAQISRLDHAMTFLSWDQMVVMPKNGNDSRSAAIAELASVRHARLTAPEVGDWLDSATGNQLPETARSINEMRRVWRQEACLPADLVKARVIAGSACEHGWRTQRLENDWTGFLANFREVVTLSREEARLRQAHADFDTPYSALLDLHCAGDSQALIDSVFTKLRKELPELIQQVMEHQQTAKAVDIVGEFPVQQQQQLCEKLMAVLGFDFDAGRLDESMHPFSTGGPGDQRITTRYRNHEFFEALSSTAHEVGHASYEGGLPEQSRGLPIGASRNMCIHESQSLMFEKQVFLSRSFMTFFTESIHQILPSSAGYDASAFWSSCTRVKPGYIRVEADEICYPLHVVLRYEIESALINGDIEADAIPEMWDQKMTHYLGLSTQGDFANGCLQDIHWTDGAFGYFPSYTMGAINSAQLFATVRSDFPDWQDRFARGETGFLREWLEQKIWSKGCELDSQELMVNATGHETDPSHYLTHLRDRYLKELY